MFSEIHACRTLSAQSVRPAFASNHVAAFLILGSLAVWGLTELRPAFRRRTEARSNDGSSLYALRLAVLVGALLAVAALGVRAATFPFTPAVAALTLAMLWAGIALRWWSVHALGRYFTFRVMTSADQPVVMTGPYRFLRHPSYLGLLLVFGGLGLAYGNWLSLVALVLTSLADLVNRIRVEESALSEALGSAYPSYAATRKRVLPFVW